MRTCHLKVILLISGYTFVILAYFLQKTLKTCRDTVDYDIPFWFLSEFLVIVLFLCFCVPHWDSLENGSCPWYSPILLYFCSIHVMTWSNLSQFCCSSCQISNQTFLLWFYWLKLIHINTTAYFHNVIELQYYYVSLWAAINS